MQTRRTRIKICGITNAADAAAAVAAGADALGVVLAPSPRQVDIDRAAAALAGIPPFVARVGVFVDADPDFVRDAAARIGLDYLQFHGSETPEMCASAPAPVVKSYRIGTEFDAGVLEPYREAVAAVLLDTYDSQRAGGTGKTFSWRIVHELPGWASVVLAGGLTPANVAGAIAEAGPYAVDVSSGVESAPGIKDHTKLSSFCAAVRAADTERPTP